MRFVIVIFSVFLLVSCSGVKDKYTLESDFPVELKEANYQEFSPGARGLSSSISVSIKLAENSSEDVQLKGLYFHDQYVGFTSTEGNKFTAAMKGTPDNEVMDDVQKKVKETNKEDFPFQLNPDEAVVCYLQKGKLKYYKVQLKRVQGIIPPPM